MSGAEAALAGALAWALASELALLAAVPALSAGEPLRRRPNQAPAAAAPSAKATRTVRRASPCWVWAPGRAVVVTTVVAAVVAAVVWAGRLGVMGRGCAAGWRSGRHRWPAGVAGRPSHRVRCGRVRRA